MLKCQNSSLRVQERSPYVLFFGERVNSKSTAAAILLMSPHHTLVVWFASIQWVCTPDTLIQSNPGQQRLSRMLESFEGDHLKFW